MINEATLVNPQYEGNGVTTSPFLSIFGFLKKIGFSVIFSNVVFNGA